MVQARRPHHHPTPPPIAHPPAYVFARHAGHRREVALANLVAEHDASRAVVLADMLADLEDRTRHARLYRQKAGGAHCLVGLSQARGHHVDEVLVDFRMPYGPFFEFRAADETQLAISDREHQPTAALCRGWQARRRLRRGRAWPGYALRPTPR